MYVGRRSMLDNRSKVVNWTTFSIIFGLFPGSPMSVPRTIFINRKVPPRGSGAVLRNFSRFFRKVFRKPPDHFPALLDVFSALFENMVWGLGGGSEGWVWELELY